MPNNQARASERESEKERERKEKGEVDRETKMPHCFMATKDCSNYLIVNHSQQGVRRYAHTHTNTNTNTHPPLSKKAVLSIDVCV